MEKIYTIWIKGICFYFTAEKPLSEKDIEKLETIAEDMKEYVNPATKKEDTKTIFQKFLKKDPSLKLHPVTIGHAFRINGRKIYE